MAVPLRTGLVSLVVTLLGLAWAGPASAQACAGAGQGISAGPAVGLVHYEFGDGTDGLELGARLRWRGSFGEAALEPYVLSLDGALTRPIGVRGSFSLPLLELMGVSLCADVMAGATRFDWEDDSGLTAAAGAGATASTTIALGGTVLVPFLGARGIGATTSGEVLGLELDASGASFGVEGGAEVAAGRVDVRASVSVDGFAAGLGPTPYPARSLRLAIGWRF